MNVLNHFSLHFPADNLLPTGRTLVLSPHSSAWNFLSQFLGEKPILPSSPYIYSLKLLRIFITVCRSISRLNIITCTLFWLTVRRIYGKQPLQETWENVILSANSFPKDLTISFSWFWIYFPTILHCSSFFAAIITRSHTI